MSIINPGSSIFNHIAMNSTICAGSYPQCYMEAVTDRVLAHGPPLHSDCSQLFEDDTVWPADKQADFVVRSGTLNCATALVDYKYIYDENTLTTLMLPDLRATAKELADFCFGEATLTERTAAEAKGETWNVAGCAKGQYTVTVTSHGGYF